MWNLWLPARGTPTRASTGGGRLPGGGGSNGRQGWAVPGARGQKLVNRSRHKWDRLPRQGDTETGRQGDKGAEQNAGQSLSVSPCLPVSLSPCLGTITVEQYTAATALVSGNRAELREVLTNLVFNAVDAMP